MRNVFVLAVAGLLLATGGCFGSRCCHPCVEMCWPGNCCQSWDWYKECDLVEGREYRECRVCDNMKTYQGMVVSRGWAEPARAPAGSAGADVFVAPAPATGLPPPSVSAPVESCGSCGGGR